MNREAGKGDVPRPFSVTQEEYGRNFDQIFSNGVERDPINDPELNPVLEQPWIYTVLNNSGYVKEVPKPKKSIISRFFNWLGSISG